MGNGSVVTHRAAVVYTAACNDRGYTISAGGVVIKAYRLAPVCLLLGRAERISVSVEFARYDIANAGFMLN